MKNLIIDSNNYFYRGVVSFGAKQEDSYTIVYNFFRNIRATVEHFQPDNLFFALEGHPIHRYSLYPEYKATRIIKEASDKKNTKQRFMEEAKIIVDLLKYLPCSVVHHSKFEADDIIYTLVQDLNIDENIIVSTDDDYHQLLTLKNVAVYNPRKKEFLQQHKYNYVAFKSLVGDKSDNIPRLISDKKACAMMEDPELFKEFIDNEENLANFNINYNLIKFQQIPLDELSIEYNSFNKEALKLEFENFEFKSLLEQSYFDKFCFTFEKPSEQELYPND